jgi:hypothetical protein
MPRWFLFHEVWRSKLGHVSDVKTIAMKLGMRTGMIQQSLVSTRTETNANIELISIIDESDTWEIIKVDD